IFGDPKAALGRGQQHDPPGDAELQGRGRVLVDEGFLDRRLVGAEAFEHLVDLAKQRDEPLGEWQVNGGVHDPIGDMGQPIASPAAASSSSTVAVFGRQPSRAEAAGPKRCSSASRTLLKSSGAEITTCPSASLSTSPAPASIAASSISSALAAVAG